MSVTRNYARHLRVITVLQTITLQLRIVTRKVRNYGVITHFTHLQRNAGSVQLLTRAAGQWSLT